MSIDFDALTTECDGLFLIFDTAKHGGWAVDEKEVREHINECEQCQELGNAEALD